MAASTAPARDELRRPPARSGVSAPPRSRRRATLARAALALFAVLAAYAAYDLFAPRSSDLRDFDPDEVARLDTEMWRSYYARERLQLFRQLGELMRSQYRMPPLRSTLAAYHAARAAFAFKDGGSRADYERALPYLGDFFGEIRGVSATDFDVDGAARLELEWWIVHRERARHAPGDLERALAEAAAAVYRVAPERLAEHARLRAEAMAIRDTRAEAGGVTDEDWSRIAELLRGSWRALHAAVNAPA
jgi:hypothetical protein